MYALLTIVCISSLPSWWWTKGPGLGDPPRGINTMGRLGMFAAAVAGGLAVSLLFGTDSSSTMAVAAYAGGRLASRLAWVALNPQPLPPKAIGGHR